MSQQLQLVRSGSFVDALASCFTRMPQADFLGFFDTIEGPSPHQIALLERDRFPEALCHDMEWNRVQFLASTPMVPAKLMFDLPIAIHKLGRTIRNPLVDCFPCQNMSAMLTAPGPISRAQDRCLWSGIRAPLQNLHTVAFQQPLDHAQYRLPPPALGKAYPHLKLFSRAIFSGPDLERVYVYMDAPEKMMILRNQGKLTVAPLLDGLQWKHIKVFSLAYAALTESQLIKWLAPLGPILEVMFFEYIHLRAGTWGLILDRLRELVDQAKQHHEMIPRVYLRMLREAEMNEGSHIKIRANLYVRGQSDQGNPCKLYHSVN
ncbi:uncharacterized protein BO97DRAFT_86281 [Aspergillus homomorphus CBS 101889]|uniref:Uncharacterized protein n=1 Tax=Aspergillus homomorphus (strain CBS 101889) TaxID=1450537 RepID=A0A395HY62_ASPHC|nr:hypothetical protein BO97DRAFT_86281 [Aspergillus homomorphus CBS 101889]RAL11798.1 hypothetical protein BO97DRAFT_86281 [Aspergillus homomorphus CBS 101889]